MTPYENRQLRVQLNGVVATHSEAVAKLTKPGDVAVVKRGILRSIVMRCPDGCGDTITLNLDPRTDKAWRLYHSRSGLTLFPSVWRDTGCRSHFILWNDVLYWVDIYDIDEKMLPQEKELEDRVWSVLKPDVLTDFVVLADSMGKIPWAVLDACRRLVKMGRAVAGDGPLRTSFKRI